MNVGFHRGSGEGAVRLVRMLSDFTVPLWLLKLGALLNLLLIWNLLTLSEGSADGRLVVPALILLVGSAYRCLFPNRYKDNVVLHESWLSSTLVTRLLATCVEVAWIYQFSHVIRLLNSNEVLWVDALSWAMVAQVVVSQIFVWGAILTGRLVLYFYEEVGWALIFLANTIASAFLYTSLGAPGSPALLLELNLIFGCVYLPWQWIHLRTLRADASQSQPPEGSGRAVSGFDLAQNLQRSFRETNRATDSESWGGIVGLTWMTAYWASLIPLWVHQVVVEFSREGGVR